MSVFRVSHDCYELGLRAGAIVLHDVKIEESSPELRRQIEEEVRQICSNLSRPADIRSLPEIKAAYNVLRRVGVKPRSHPPSTQKLLEFALKKETLPSVNNLVDAYNLISLQTKCSLGAHDLDRVTSPVELRLFRGDEIFRPLGSEVERPVVRGEFGYVDAQSRVICRLDSLQADFSKVTMTSTNVLLIIEGTEAQSTQQLKRIFANAAAMVTEVCGGTFEVVAFPNDEKSVP